jgi:hypothetical protein
MSGMLELVVSDDLTPPLACPLCGWLYVKCSLQVPDEGPKCAACGGRFRLLEMVAKDTVPAGISVGDKGRDWTIEILTRSPKSALLNGAGGLALLALTVLIWMNGGWMFSGGDESDGLRKLGVVTFIGSMAMLATAVWRFWGRYRVSGSGQAGAVFQGVAGMGSRRTFQLPVINGVCLTKAVYVDRRGNQLEKRVVRLEGVDFYMDLGEDLSDRQRAYLALFLLQKRLEFGRAPRPKL